MSNPTSTLIKRTFAIFIFATCILAPLVGASCCSLISHSKTPADTSHDPAMAGRLQQSVEQLCASPRYAETQDVARNAIEQRLRAAGWQVERQTFEQDGGVFHNIIAIREGGSGMRYIIGAHYDACDTGEEDGNPGADDNASAVSTLLEIAERLPRTAPKHTLELVFYACEEPPWFGTEGMGSAHHAASCHPEEVLGMICLEMLGYYSDEPDSQPPLFAGAGLLLPTVGDFIAVVGDTDATALASKAEEALAENMPVLRLNLPFVHDTALYFSDHRNYQPLGIPSIMVTDTAMLRNPNYHEPTDTPDTLDYPRMARVAAGLIRFIEKLAW